MAASKSDTVHVVTLTTNELEVLLERAAAAGAARVSPPPEVLNSAEAAELLRLNEQTVTRLAKAGALPANRVGRDWRFRRSALLAWLETQRGKVA